MTLSRFKAAAYQTTAAFAKLAALTIFTVGCATRQTAAAVAPVAAAGAPTAHPYVIMVSFDAFRYDYIDRYHPAAFEDIARRGIRTGALISAFPSKTFPNHYTLATGLYPGHHGITGNTFFDPVRSAWYRSGDSIAVRDGTWYAGEPIWTTAERNGVKSGAFFWSGSEADIAGARPSYWEKYDGKVSNEARVNGVVSWLQKRPADRPHLVLLYFSEVDDTTHKHGPDAEQTRGAVADVDRALQQLLDSLHGLPFADSVNVVLVSDHGMASTPPDSVIDVSALLLRGGVDTSGVLMSDNGPTMSLWFGVDSLKLQRSRAVLIRGLTHAHAMLRSEAPARWHLADNKRFGDLLLVADEGFVLKRRGADKAPSAGSHGYDPAVVSMRGIFLAAGPGVRALGRIAPIENVNVYPFVAALLRLESVPVVDGSLDVLRSALMNLP